MVVNSIEFIAFVACVSVVFFIVPRRFRHIWLLAASFFFYSIWSVANAAILFVSGVATYWLGIKCEAKPEGAEPSRCPARKTYLLIGILLLAGELYVFKYLNFTLNELGSLFGGAKGGFSLKPINLLMPVGVSFYIFQTIGYLVDVYKGKVKAERSLARFLLFITFFPKIIQGPIERSNGFLKQVNDLENRSRFEYKRVTNGLITALWGFFMKMVIADRIAIVADTVFSTYYIYGTVELAFAAICYALQIYCDFAGYSAIAVGVGRIFGFELIQNFDCPYFSSSTREFWRRWHISLSAWFRDYVYIPLGGSRCAKWRKRLNVVIVMLVSGIWHGAGWTFVAWGLIHGLYQVAGDCFSARIAGIQERLHMRTGSVSYRIGKIIVTFLLIDLAWIFFRAESIGVALDYIVRMFTHYNPWVLFDGSLLKLGLDQIEVNVLCMSLLILIVVDLVQYIRGIRIDQMLENQCLWFRWGVIILLFTFTWVFGMYGPTFSSSSFIYQSF